MALLASDVITASYNDLRQSFIMADKDTFYVSWVDRVQKDILHSSPVWSVLQNTSEDLTTIAGQSRYILTANNIRHIKQLFDLSRNNQLIPYSDMNFPAGTSVPAEREGPGKERNPQAQATSTLYPRYYNVEMCITEGGGTTQALHIFPAPKTNEYTGIIRYFYTKYAPTVSDVGDTLVIPEDGFDILVAGVNMYAARFQLMPTEATMWQQLYEGMKKV